MDFEEKDFMDLLQWEDPVNSDAELSEISSVKSEISEHPSPYVYDSPASSSAQWEPSPRFNEDYRTSQQILRDSIFGRTHTADGSAPVPMPHEDHTHTLAAGTGPHPYKYSLHLGDLPVRSRVETQIKCSLVFSPPPDEHLLHLPADTIARPRFQLRDDATVMPQALYLDVDVILPDAPHKQVYMCAKCICREKKRAFRKKTLDLNEEYHWNETQTRRLIIFNCRELVAIPMPKTTKLSDGTTAMARQIDLPLRLACYCRHHGAKSGYRLLFTVRDWQHNIVARTISEDIFITDNHKELRSSAAESSASELSASEPVRRPSHHGHQQQSNGSSYHPYARSGYDRRSSSVSSSNSIRVQQQQQQQPPPALPQQVPLPPSEVIVQRAIPAQGSVRGGVEVTLLGTGFHSNLVAMFGDNAAISTQCWSDNTIIAHLPPSNVAGPVVISFQGHPQLPMSAIFTYTNDSEVKLVELALQVVGFKMNGKIEDATDVASRIVNQEYSGGSSGFVSPAAGGPQDSQQVVLQCLEFVRKDPGYVNLNLRNSEGQTMMHMACVLGYSEVVHALMSQGAHVDVQDVSGYTPLHFAVLFGNRAITRMLLNAHADPFHRNFGGKTAIDMADSTVVDLLPKNQRLYYQQLNTNSSSTLASVFSEENLVSAAPQTPSAPSVSHLIETSHKQERNKAATLASRPSASNSSSQPVLPQTTTKNDWMHFVQRIMWFGRDEPPRYLDLFPHGNASSKVEKAASPVRHSVIEISQSESSDEFSGGNNDESSEGEVDGHESIAEEEVFATWAQSPLKQIRNDHMLFTFWLPLFVIAVSYLITIAVNVSDFVHWKWISNLHKPIQRLRQSK